ncbi:hypothetical protein QBC37DRAFT_155178 [Rhypophila decipiens]|uniref:Uncharacterized protein n=1 Tax=Rhypophila decipiens TaxID=261697 RepID=A0AAN6YAM3_9PEZI|nr:hypothetical protein QBC37DRAFT_155178 [Rhypophila decipiens]
MDETFPKDIVNLSKSCGYQVMERLHTLHLTLRSSNWAAIDMPQQDFSFDPYNWVFKPFALADALLLMPALRRLVIDFETELDRFEAMERYIEENVKEWQFLVLSNPPPTVFKVQGDNGKEIKWYWKPGKYFLDVGAKQTRAYQMVDPFSCYVNDGHTSIPLSSLRPEEEPVEWASHPPPPSLAADIKGDNGEPVKWGWLKLNLTKNPVEMRSYASPLPGHWEGPGFLRPLRVLDAEGQLVLIPQEEEEVEDMRLVSYRLEWTFRTGVPGEHVPAKLWCCDADGRYEEPPEELPVPQGYVHYNWQHDDDDDL